MRLSVLQENLIKGLNIVNPAVAGKSTMPILSNVLLQTDNGSLRISATNLEMGISTTIGAKVEVAGAITVPAKTFLEFIKSLPPERVDMELDEATSTLSVKCARYKSNIKGVHHEEFPLIPTYDKSQGDEFVIVSPKTMIDQTVFAAATDMSRPTLTGIFLKIDNNDLSMASADGFRLSVKQAVTPNQVNLEVVVPANSMREVAKLSSNEAVKGKIRANQIIFSSENTNIYSQLLEGKFPDYNNIIPTSYQTSIVVDRNSLKNAVKVANIFSQDNAHIVKFTVTQETLIVSGVSSERGDNESVIDAEIYGEVLVIGFNGKFVMDALNAIDTPLVILKFNSDAAPCVVGSPGDDSFTHVIMPMHLKR